MKWKAYAVETKLPQKGSPALRALHGSEGGIDLALIGIGENGHLAFNDPPYADFDDPVFLEKLDHFLAAAAARYDGKPELAFIDIGTPERFAWAKDNLNKML